MALHVEIRTVRQGYRVRTAGIAVEVGGKLAVAGTRGTTARDGEGDDEPGNQ
jgi:hypothetical protein